jgi:myo-inositol-1-phosphate synthase
MTIRTAIVGVGNCASSLVQTLAVARAGDPLEGVTHPLVGGYSVADIEIVAAFDVDARKVGQDVADAVFAEPNCTTQYVPVPQLGIDVTPGVPLDGIANGMRSVVPVTATCDSMSVEQVTGTLEAQQAEIVLIFLPVGAVAAAEAYARAALAAGCSLINFTPTPIATSNGWATLFEEAGQALLGDDTKSQIGSTVVHRALLSLLTERGIRITESYQINAGGNSDFKNMIDPVRAAHKVKTKLASLQQFASGASIAAGPNGCIPHLRDHKVGYIHIDGTGLLGMSVSLEVKLQVEDSPNAAAVAVNAVRAARVAIDRQIRGTVDAACAHLFKNPPCPMSDADATRSFDEFAACEDGSGTAP